MQHTQRIQAVLEEANVKLSSAITDVLGQSGRRILKALIAGETDPDKLASLGSPRLASARFFVHPTSRSHTSLLQPIPKKNGFHKVAGINIKTHDGDSRASFLFERAGAL